MLMTKKNEAASESGAPRFGKEKLLGFTRYAGRRDLLSALLDDDREYTTEQVDGLLRDFLKGKVI